MDLNDETQPASFLPKVLGKRDFQGASKEGERENDNIVDWSH